jgi:PAP2 superfamily protein
MHGPGARRAGLHGPPRLIIVGLWLTAAVAVVVTRGIPVDRPQVLAWIVGTLALATVVSGGQLRRVLLDWLPLVGLLLAYDLTRGAADTLGMPVQVRSIASLESALFWGHVPTVWLQERLYGDRQTAAWWELPISLVYMSHFVAVYAIGAWCWTRGRERWWFWLRRFGGVTASGLVAFVLMPAAPPWLASSLQRIGPVERTTVRGLSVAGLDVAGRLLDTGQSSVNLVAAMPSLHAAHAALVVALLWPGRGRAARIGLLAYPLAMGFVLVLTGEHYVVDVLAGFALTAAVCRIAQRWERHPRVPAPPPPPSAPLSPPPTWGVTAAQLLRGSEREPDRQRGDRRQRSDVGVGRQRGHARQSRDGRGHAVRHLGDVAGHQGGDLTGEQVARAGGPDAAHHVTCREALGRLLVELFGRKSHRRWWFLSGIG